MRVRLTHREHQFGPESRFRSFVSSTRSIDNAQATYRGILVKVSCRRPCLYGSNPKGQQIGKALPYCIGPIGMNLQDFYSLEANCTGPHRYSWDQRGHKCT